MATEFSENSEHHKVKYYCELCDYTCFKKQHIKQHKTTKSHKNKEINSVANSVNNTEKNKLICFCGKVYHDRSGLWRHKKKCDNGIQNENNKMTENSLQISPTLIMEMIQDNKELREIILEQNKTIAELSKNTTNIQNNINSHNKTFNLQVFLNETCKDAMNIMDFVDSLKIQLADLENVGKLGFADGISNIIIKNLKALDIEKRPVHCSDTKRETLYIKDEDRWEKEGENKEKLKKAIKSVANKNISMIPEWKEKYPDCTYADSKKSDQYNHIMIQSLDYMNPQHSEKIIKKISKEVAIEK